MPNHSVYLKEYFSHVNTPLPCFLLKKSDRALCPRQALRPPSQISFDAGCSPQITFTESLFNTNSSTQPDLGLMGLDFDLYSRGVDAPLVTDMGVVEEGQYLNIQGSEPEIALQKVAYIYDKDFDKV